MKKPVVSIAIVTYNRCKYLKESLCAALAQTFQDFELLIVDNASDDNTSDMVKEFHDHRLVYIRRSTNEGPAANYIEAMARARGDFLLISHDDDIMSPTLVERQIQAFAVYPEAVLIASNVSLIDYRGEILRNRLHDSHEDLVFKRGEFLKAWLHQGFWLPAPTFMIRRHLGHGKLNLFDLFTHPEKDAANLMGITGDTWSACKVNGMGSIVFLSEPLLAYRQHQGQHNFNDDQVGVQVPFYRCVLKYLCKRKPVFRPYTTEVEALLLRYQAQELALNNLHTYHRKSPLLRQLKRLDSRLAAKRNRAEFPDYYTQFALLLLLLGSECQLLNQIPEQWISEKSLNHLSGFRKWTASLTLNSLPISAALLHKGVKKVAILGSLLNAANLALDCHKSGIEVIGFLDSNRLRTNRTLWGLPIMPLDDVQTIFGKIDMLLFSSEKKDEATMKNYLGAYISEADLDRCASWMTLAANTPLKKEGA